MSLDLISSEHNFLRRSYDEFPPPSCPDKNDMAKTKKIAIQQLCSKQIQSSDSQPVPKNDSNRIVEDTREKAIVYWMKDYNMDREAAEILIKIMVCFK